MKFSKISYLPNTKASKVLVHSRVRSGTIDRQPIIGRHPYVENYYLFNGFWLQGDAHHLQRTEHIADFLLSGKPFHLR